MKMDHGKVTCLLANRNRIMFSLFTFHFINYSGMVRGHVAFVTVVGSASKAS